jgi:hypothetical protein
MLAADLSGLYPQVETIFPLNEPDLGGLQILNVANVITEFKDLNGIFRFFQKFVFHACVYWLKIWD